LKKAERDGDISQDDHKLYADEVQSLTDKYVGEIDETVKQKEAEIMQV
ncbi:MAG: ribosome recycling factor, partial [Alphaproteobacteria bacterium]